MSEESQEITIVIGTEFRKKNQWFAISWNLSLNCDTCVSYVGI